ncbi:hypothetical protein LXN10_00985 [Arcobacter sp. KX21116]|uniref:hypothetical protein n=1 Tax=Arcobacter iocasae TaxID=2906515 RepID=UPI0035D4217E
MNILDIKLKNCYGIKKLQKAFNYTPEFNVNIIYAKNGLMKTSFTKVFKKFQDNKQDEIQDLIFNSTPVSKDIKVDGNDINKEDIFVIHSFEQAYESNSISSLLVNDTIKQQLEEVLILRTNILKNLEKKSGLKISKTSLGKTIFELEPTIIKDFGFEEKSILQNLDDLELAEENNYLTDVQYSIIFDESVLNKKIKSEQFQTKIDEYITKSDEIYGTYDFFEKGKFTLPKLKEIQKKLKGNNFFVKENKISLGLGQDFSSLTELNRKIKEIEDAIQSSEEFKAIEKLLSDAKGMVLKDTIEKYPDILLELKIENIENLRKKLWLSYFKNDEENFNSLKEKYQLLKENIESLDINDTPWKEAIDIFNARFDLPFKMDIENLTSSIIGESLPKVVFSFCDKENIDDCIENDWVRLNRDELEQHNTLSQGERRALYLLNIIFDIEQRKRENQKTLFIIDDIADSFDYRNKYAIIEYLKDISEKDNFYLLILSHNFDFYRTISGRLNLTRENKFHAIKSNDEIIIEKEYYQNQPFVNWKKNLNINKHVIALIPFVRNLIEYGIDDKKDYILLTHLLHIKNETQYKSDGKRQSQSNYNEVNGDFTIESIYDIDFGKLKGIYRKYIGKDNFNNSINDIDKVYDLIIDIADNNISNDNINLENKIILAIAIRLKAEKYMINKINDNTFLDNISGVQTRVLYNRYSTDFSSELDKIRLLDSVNIMTPENIHLNSFMYEPLLDMDIVELKSLYTEVKSLI